MNLVSGQPEATAVQGQAQISQANIDYANNRDEQRVSGSKYIYMKFLL